MVVKRKSFIGWRRFLGLLLLSVCSCAVSPEKVETGGGHLLPQPSTSPDVIGVDIYFVRIPYHNRELLRQLWSEVDEQFGEPTFRRKLMDQGLRVGVQGVSLSPTLTKMINATATPPTTDPSEVFVAEIQKDPIVRRQFRHMVPGMQTLLRPYADPVPEMSLFWSENGHLCGRTFKDAQGLIGLVVTPLRSGQVRFAITPEVIHGTLETRYNFQGGAVFPEIARPKHVFSNLAVSMDLLPGQWIIIGPASEKCSGIGHCFFIRERDETEQKVILLRLARSQRDTAFETSPLLEVSPNNDFRMLERN